MCLVPGLNLEELQQLETLCLYGGFKAILPTWQFWWHIPREGHGYLAFCVSKVTALLLVHSLCRNSCYTDWPRYIETTSQCKSIIVKSCGLEYILVQQFLENEICHTILTGYYKKSKSTILICVHLLGRAYDSIEVTKAISWAEKIKWNIGSFEPTFWWCQQNISYFFLWTFYPKPTLYTPLPLHKYLKFLTGKQVFSNSWPQFHFLSLVYITVL